MTALTPAVLIGIADKLDARTEHFSPAEEAESRAIARRWGCSPARCPLASFAGAVHSEPHRKALLSAIAERVEYFTADRPRPALYRQREAQAVTELRLLDGYVRQAPLQPPARPARKGLTP